MQTTRDLPLSVSASIHLIPSVATPVGMPSRCIAPSTDPTASDSGWFTGTVAMTNPGMCSISRRMSVTSVYPSTLTIGDTRTLDVRNWGPSCVLTPLRGGIIDPEMTMADTLSPRTSSSSDTALSITSIMSASDAPIGIRFEGYFIGVSEGVRRIPKAGFGCLAHSHIRRKPLLNRPYVQRPLGWKPGDPGCLCRWV